MDFRSVVGADGTQREMFRQHLDPGNHVEIRHGCPKWCHQGKPWASIVKLTMLDTNGHRQETYFLELDAVPMWLASIDPGNYGQIAHSCPQGPPAERVASSSPRWSPPVRRPVQASVIRPIDRRRCSTRSYRCCASGRDSSAGAGLHLHKPAGIRQPGGFILSISRAGSSCR
jgi:hypothetical protein